MPSLHLAALPGVVATRHADGLMPLAIKVQALQMVRQVVAGWRCMTERLQAR